MSRVSDRSKKGWPYFTGKNIIIMCVLGGVVASAIFLSSRSLIIDRLHLLSDTVSAKTIASNGADQWDNDDTVTVPTTSTFSLQASEKINVSSLFNQYYQSHGVAENLGVPVTAAFPVDQGWMQFFTSGALVLPPTQRDSSHTMNEALATLINDGTKDPATGIVSLPLLQALLTEGSKAPIGGVGSPVTYVDLRKAADPALMQTASTKQSRVTSSNNLHAHFVQVGMRTGKDVGHFIPQVFWSYINRTDISPDGWVKDFGDPLTEALSFTLPVNGSSHHMLVQAFVRNGVLLDQNIRNASGRPLVQQLTTGIDYLRTFGFPPVSIYAQQAIWVQGEADLLMAPDSEQVIVHVGQNFTLKLLGDTRWTAGMLWYHVQWSALKSTHQGWISAANITFVSPGNVPQFASLNILSPQLTSYLSTFGSNVGVMIYDASRQRYYTYNSSDPFIVASSMKVPIMLTFFDSLERQGQEPDDNQMNVLTTMIENSDNDSASDLYYNELNGAASITDYMKKIGVSGLNPDADAWGYSTITPQTMVDLLTLLYEGKILTTQDRATVYNLMENIESDQQVGVGDTAPTGFTVAMKDGWVIGPDNLWAMNSSGIVMSNKETYIISVYTQEQQSLDDGQAIVKRVCSSVASLLT